MDAYQRSAHAYDVILRMRGRDYARQADQLIEIIGQHCPSAATLLDVGCGTGHHLRRFKDSYGVAGVDLSPSMLERAREFVPDVELQLGDMRTFVFGRSFDAITCLFSSIGYLVALDDMRAAVANMVRHLNPGGVLLVEPWIHPDQWIANHHGVAEAANEDGISVSRVSITGLEGELSFFDLHWTVATNGGVESFVEHHVLGLYTVDEYREAMESAGLTVEHDPVGPIGRGLFIGLKNRRT